jgi:hypothetical protein
MIDGPYLPEIAHIEIHAADRAIREMISLGSGDAISVGRYSAGS